MAENVLYSTDGKVLQPDVWKCVIDKLLKMSYSLVGGNILSQQRGKDIYKCVLAQCAEMCLYGNVAKTHLQVLLKSTVG